jgi:5-methyltetrahydropteroyltriglutamate--homocysteine methyltransferase
MAITTTVVGSYPKPPDEGDVFTVRKTIQALDRGDAALDDLRAAQDGLARDVIAEQESAGIDIVTDGQVRWDDILTPFARSWAGFEVGGLLRWFDNNTYYRRPVCTGKVEWRGPASVDGFRFAVEAATSSKVKAVIPGPVSFALLSVDEHYADHENFVLDIASVLAQEAAELEAAGAAIIQIDEPALLGAPEELALAKKALAVIAAGLSEAETILGTYFGDAKRLGTDIFELPVNGFAFDLVAGPENIELIRAAPDGVRIQAGIVDARNTKLESTDALRTQIEELVSISGPEQLWIAPSAGLEYLPREKARAKLQLLGAVAQEVSG